MNLRTVRSPRCSRQSACPDLNRLKGFARTVLFATYVIPTVAVAIVWGALYEPSYGPLAEMFKAVGLSRSEPSKGVCAHRLVRNLRHPHRRSGDRVGSPL